MASSSPLTRPRDDDGEILRSKRPKTTLVSSSTGSKITWTKNDELLILEGILDYEDETKLSYGSDWDAFYGYIKCFVQANFSKVQLRNKIRKLKKRFTDKSENGKGPFLTNTDDDEIFNLSMIIWGKRNENVNTDQANVVIDEHITEDVEQAKDLANVEHDEQINKNVEQPMDLTNVEHDPINENIDETMVDNGENKNKESEKVGVEEFCVLQEAVEAISVPSLGKTHQKLLLQNLKNLEAEKGKELIEEWQALLVEEMQLRIKKLTYSAKLGNAVV